MALQRHRASRQRAALFDRLTGLPNRAFFLQLLETTRRRGGAGPLAVFFLTHARFKNVSDTLGHAWDTDGSEHRTTLEFGRRIEPMKDPYPTERQLWDGIR